MKKIILGSGRYIRLLFAVELFVLLALIISSIHPIHKYSITINPSNILIDDLSVVDTDGNLLLVRNNAYPADKTVYKSDSMALAPGGYELTVDYLYVLDDLSSVQPGQQFKLAYLEGISEAYPTSVVSSKNFLISGLSSSTSRIWIRSFMNIPDFQLKIVSKNNAAVGLTSITLTENPIWRVSRILEYLFIVFIFDFLLLYLLDEKRTVQQRYTVFVLTGTVIAASLPFFSDFIYDGHDLEYHLSRICALAAELGNGQFPVRMQTSMLQNHGYASSLFYGDIFLYLPAALYLMMFPLTTSYQVYAICINAVTVVISYYCFRKIFSSQRLGLLGSLLYSISPYRIFCLHTRAAVGEYTALTFLPLLMLGLHTLCTAKRKLKLCDYIPLIIGVTGVIQSHILTCEEIVMIGVLFFLFNIPLLAKPPRLLSLIKAAGITICLNAFFLIPFLMSYQMDLKVKAKEIQSIRNLGIYPGQLVSLFYTTQSGTNSGTFGESATCLGIVIILGLILFIICAMNRHTWALYRYQEYNLGKKTFLYTILTIMISSCIFPWENIALVSENLARLLCAIQFPWRFLSISTILGVTIFLCATSMLYRKFGKHLFYGISSVVVLLTAISLGYFYTTLIANSENHYYYSFSDFGTMSIGGGCEYLLSGTDINFIYDDKPTSSSEYITILNYEKEGNVWQLSCENTSDSAIVTIPVFNYDNYKAYDTYTGMEIAITYGENNKIALIIPSKYCGTIQILYKEPILWRIAEIVSLICLILLLFHYNIIRKHITIDHVPTGHT